MELLKKLTQCSAPSGCESTAVDIIKNEIQNYADEIYTDALGNLIAHKKGTGKKIMLCAHCDEIGVIVTFIDEKGFLRFSNIGGLDVGFLVHRRVRFENGTVGIIGCEDGFDKDKKLSKLYIDIGAADYESAAKLVNIGDSAVFEGSFEICGATVISKALDNRAGCYVLIEAAKRIKTDNDMYYMFTTQEEVGLRGAKTASFGVEPEFAIAVDVTDTGDTPKCPEMAVKLGAGAAVKVMDRSVICDGFVRDTLIRLAEENEIAYQREIMTDGGTDAGAVHLSRGGVKTGGVSIPTRYIHSPSEMASVEDINSCIELVKLFCENI